MVFAIVKSCLEPKIALHQRVKPEEARQLTEPFSSIAVDITRASTYFKIELNGSVILFCDETVAPYEWLAE
jgi:hypothetical protein